MKSSNRIRIERLEIVTNINCKNRMARLICDNPKNFDFSTIEADHILIFPDNGRRYLGKVLNVR